MERQEDVHRHNEGCIDCALDFDFRVPDGLIDTAHRRDLVIFAGAGISTEVPAVFPATFYEDVQTRLGIKDGLSFPSLMQLAQDQHGRQVLIRTLKQRFNYIDSFPSLRLRARKFHRELATMPYLRDVITTNWDTYFEAECLATPFISGEDFVFHGMPGRRVYKIHGSMTALWTIVLTESDYASRLEELRNNVLGGALRQLLATKTVVFIGYSLRDWNFRRLYDALRQDMGKLAPRAYFVSPFPSAEATNLGLEEIRTSGVQFLRTLKSELINDHFLPDEVYDVIAELKDRVFDAKDILARYSHKKYSALAHCWAYHDGLLDACGRILSRRGSGEYSDKHHVTHMIDFYDDLHDRSIEEGRYWEGAYIDGYTNGLINLLIYSDEELRDGTPLYSIYGSGSSMTTEAELKEALEHSRRRAPKARAEAKTIVANLPEGSVMTHRPFLSDVPSDEW